MKPTQAGGTVRALVGALADSLGVMRARLGQKAEAQRQLVHLSQRLHALVQGDVEANQGESRASKMPKERWDERSTEIAYAWQKATEVQLEIAEIACHAG